MKKLFIVLLATILLGACNKSSIAPTSINGPIQSSNLTLSERVYGIKNGTSPYNPAYSDYNLRNFIAQGCILFGGDSHEERGLYANWVQQWYNRPVVNRGIGGTTIAQQMPFLKPLITGYNPRVVVLSLGNNEYHNHMNANRTGLVSSYFIPDFRRLIDSIIKQCPSTIIIARAMITSPKLYDRGYDNDIKTTNAAIKAKVLSVRGVYIDNRDKFPSWTGVGTIWETDRIHPKLSYYSTGWNPRVKAAIDSIYKLPRR
jgi:hypothetical protein